MSLAPDSRLDLQKILRRTTAGKALINYPTGQIVYAQGDPADCVFYIESGSVNVTVRTTDGEEAVVETLKSGSVFGEECAVGQQKRTATVSASAECTLMRIEKPKIIQLLREEPAFAACFIDQLVTRSTFPATKLTWAIRTRKFPLNSL
jgi:CRP-like cAMP-binding protein